MAYNNKVESASRRFFAIIAPSVEWNYTDHGSKPLVLAAFHLYDKNWGGCGFGFDIGRWEWPFTEIAEGGTFEGDEPWTVLLREAAKVARSA